MTTLVRLLGTETVDIVDLAHASALLRFRAARDGVKLLERVPDTFLSFRLEAARSGATPAPSSGPFSLPGAGCRTRRAGPHNGVEVGTDVVVEHDPLTGRGPELVLGPFNTDRARAHESFRRLGADIVCFGDGRPPRGDDVPSSGPPDRADRARSPGCLTAGTASRSPDPSVWCPPPRATERDAAGTERSTPHQKLVVASRVAARRAR